MIITTKEKVICDFCEKELQPETNYVKHNETYHHFYCNDTGYDYHDYSVDFCTFVCLRAYLKKLSLDYTKAELEERDDYNQIGEYLKRLKNDK